MGELWKHVPKELVDGRDIQASSHGRIRVDCLLVKGTRGTHGKHGNYRVYRLNSKPMYFHRLVFWAFSQLPIESLAKGRVLFKDVDDPKLLVDDEGFYRNHFDDLVFEPSKNTTIDLLPIVSSSPILKIHPIYGDYYVGYWYPVKAHQFSRFEKCDKVMEYDHYELCLLDSDTTPCIIRHVRKPHKSLSFSSAGGVDAMVTLSISGKGPKKYMVTHIMLASVFSEIHVKSTVDHIDDNAYNNHVNNLQWLTTSDNSKKGRSKQLKGVRDSLGGLDLDEETVQHDLPEETWTILSKTTEVSTMGRLRTFGTKYKLGSRLRGKKYRYATVKLDDAESSRKFYIHHLVWMAFHGDIPEGQIILHDDSVPLNPDGTYRNWLVDLRTGRHTENGQEHHRAKRLSLLPLPSQDIGEVCIDDIGDDSFVCGDIDCNQIESQCENKEEDGLTKESPVTKSDEFPAPRKHKVDTVTVKVINEDTWKPDVTTKVKMLSMCIKMPSQGKEVVVSDELLPEELRGKGLNISVALGNFFNDIQCNWSVLGKDVNTTLSTEHKAIVESSLWFEAWHKRFVQTQAKNANIWKPSVETKLRLLVSLPQMPSQTKEIQYPEELVPPEWLEMHRIKPFTQNMGKFLNNISVNWSLEGARKSGGGTKLSAKQKSFCETATWFQQWYQPFHKKQQMNALSS